MVFLGSASTDAEFNQLKNGIQVAGGDITDGNDNTVFDQANNQVPLSILEQDSISVTAGNGLSSGGSVQLGNTVTLDADISDIAGKYLSSDGTTTPSLTINIGRGISEGTVDGNIAVDESTEFDFTSTITISGGITLSSSDFDASTNRIKNLPSPSAASDAARKGYVDGVAQGLDIKESCVAATDGANIDLSSNTDPNPVDGITLSDGDRVLLKDQSTASENGIYVANTATDPTTWTRAEDFDDDGDVTSGAFTFVKSGNNNDSVSFTVITSDPITVGTDSILFDQFSSAGEILAGTGLNKSGKTLAVTIASFVNTSLGLNVNDNNNIEVKTGSSILIDGNGDLEIDTSNSNTFSASQTFTAGISVTDNITADSNTLYDSTNQYIPESILQTLSNSALSNSSVSLSVATGGGLEFANGTESASVSLGDTASSLQVTPGEFINTAQLSINGSGNIEIDDIFLSNSGDTVSGSFTFGDFFDLKPITEPGSPSAGDLRVFVDSNDNNMKAKAPDGSVATLINT